MGDFSNYGWKNAKEETPDDTRIVRIRSEETVMALGFHCRNAFYGWYVLVDGGSLKLDEDAVEFWKEI